MNGEYLMRGMSSGWIGKGHHGKVLHFFEGTGEWDNHGGERIRSLCGLEQVVEGAWQHGGWPRYDSDCKVCIRIGLASKEIKQLWEEGAG